MSTKDIISWIVFFVVASIVMSLVPLNTIRIDEGPEFAISCLRYILATTTLQGFLLYIAHLSGIYIFAISISLLITINVLGLNLLFFKPINSLSETHLVIAYILILLSTTYISITNIRNKKHPSFKAYFACVAIFVTPIFASEPDTGYEDTSIQDLNYWSNIHFNSKPNIYLLSFDSLIPHEVASRYLGIDKKYYDDIFLDGFTVIQKGLNFNDSTVTSLNAIMQLNQASQIQSARFFTGYYASLLENIFHTNGYRVVTGYGNRIYGKVGYHVDEYLSILGVQINSSRLCIESLGNTVLSMRFHFICNIYDLITPHSQLDKILFERQNNSKNINTNEIHLSQKGWQQLILEHIHDTVNSKIPTISFLYTYNPIGHTTGVYRHQEKEKRNYYSEFFKSGLTQLAEKIAAIRKSILENDPSSVVIVFGDHGAHLSAGMDYSENNRFILDDRFRVMHAFMSTDNHCSTHPTNYYTQEYATTSRLILDTIDCLSVPYLHDDNIVSFREKPELAKKIFSSHGN